MLQCEDCGWIGKQEDCIRVRDYRDIETLFQCPKCGSENLSELAGRGTMPRRTREGLREYYWENRERIIEQRKQRLAKNPLSSETRKKRNKQANIRKWKLKREVVTYYGNGKCACVRCGYPNIWALSIDHIDGSGNEERKKGQQRGSSFYRWLRKQGYPEGYQTLCMNCQFIKRGEDGIPK